MLVTRRTKRSARARGGWAGITSTFKPQQIAAGQTSILTLQDPAGQALSSSTLAISATATIDGIVSAKSAGVTLDVQAVTTAFMGRTVIDDATQTPLAG